MNSEYFVGVLEMLISGIVWKFVYFTVGKANIVIIVTR